MSLIYQFPKPESYKFTVYIHMMGEDDGSIILFEMWPQYYSLDIWILAIQLFCYTACRVKKKNEEDLFIAGTLQTT